MRRVLAAAALTAVTGGLALAFLVPVASAADTVRRGWTPVGYCGSCGEGPRITTMQFSDERTGWIAGGIGVARTEDGGATWSIASGLPGRVDRASVNGSRGVAVGSFEGVAVSSDGGRTWKQYRPIPTKVFDVQALPDRLLAATGSTLYSSTNGIVWTRVGVFAGGETYGSRIHFTSDGLHGTVVSAVQVATTHDGGRSWRTGLSNTYYKTIRTGAFTRDASHAFSVGVSGSGPSEYVLERTTDGGATFADVTAPPPPSVYRGLSDVAFVGDTGYAVGWEGTLLRSTDAGLTWERETPPPSFERTTFKAVSVLSADRAFAVTFGGALVTRDKPVFTETSHPYRPLGFGLAGLGGAALLGAGARAVIARPDVVAGGLLALGVVAGGGGAAAITVSDEVVPGVDILAQQEDPAAGVALATGSPTPSASLSATPSATPSATASPTPSVTAAPTRTTTAPTTRPPTTLPPIPTTVPPTTKPPGKFTVTPATLSQQCNPNYGVPSFTVTLKNGTSAAVSWTMEVIEQGWATPSATSGTVPAGGTQTVTVQPNGQMVCAQPGDYHLRVRQDTRSTVGGPVLGTVTDTISGP